MTPTATSSASLAQLIRQTRCLMLDFDGPVCAIFGGDLNARKVSAELYATAGLESQPSGDPFDALRAAAETSPDLAHQVDEALRAAELAAIATAPLTPYARQVIDTARASGRTVAIVSNNSPASIKAFLATHSIEVDEIAARTGADPQQLKPSPKLLNDALDRLETTHEHAALVGDSTTDMQAASRAGIAAIGYANRPAKTKTLADAGADVIIESLRPILAALVEA